MFFLGACGCCCTPCICGGAETPIGGNSKQIIFTAGAEAGDMHIGDVCTYCMIPHFIYLTAPPEEELFGSNNLFGVNGNDAPVADDQSITVTEDTTFTGTLTGSGSEGSSLIYAVLTQGTKGFVTITDDQTGTFTYEPNLNANGADSFTFNVNDFTHDSNTATVTVSITPVNDAPVANAQSITVTEDTTFTGTLTGTEVDGSSLICTIVTQGTKGFATITDIETGAFTYEPNLNANGADSFTFKVNDGTSDSSPATVTVNITAVNDAPVANAQSITATEDTTFTGTLTGSDIEGSSLTYSVVTQGTKGFVTITNAATGGFTYVPNLNANGADSFTFKVNDGTLDSSPATVTVNITAVYDVPVPVQTSVKCLNGCNYIDIELAQFVSGEYAGFTSGACLTSGLYRVRLFLSITGIGCECVYGDNCDYELTGWEFLTSNFSDASFIGDITLGELCD